MKSVKDTPQDRGSVITYMMRYNVGAVLGLSIDKDDDGNKATFPDKQEQTLKQLTNTVKDTMLKYIENGDIDAVKKQLPKYAQNANHTAVSKALKDAESLKDLEDSKADDIATI